MLEAKNVVKTFDGFRALDEASLTVPKGAVYGLVGPNGAGKSTIIRHFTGVYRPDSGSLTLEGQPIYENTAVKQRICVIPDDWFYFSQWSIREMARLYKGMYPTFSQERYDKMHEVFPLDDRQTPYEQGHAEAGGLLDHHELHAGVPDPGRTGGRP